MYIWYTVNLILAVSNDTWTKQIITSLNRVNLDVTEEGNLQYFQGIIIEREKRYDTFSQTLFDSQNPFLDLNLDMSYSDILCEHSDSPDFDNNFSYESVIRKTFIPKKGTHSDRG